MNGRRAKQLRRELQAYLGSAPTRGVFRAVKKAYTRGEDWRAAADRSVTWYRRLGEALLEKTRLAAQRSWLRRRPRGARA